MPAGEASGSDDFSLDVSDRHERIYECQRSRRSAPVSSRALGPGPPQPRSPSHPGRQEVRGVSVHVALAGTVRRSVSLGRAPAETVGVLVDDQSRGRAGLPRARWDE